MEFKKLNISIGPYASAECIAYDRTDACVAYMSIMGYDGTIKSISKEVNKKNKINIVNHGSYNVGYKEYEVIKSKDSGSDYAHAIIYKKDRVYKSSNGIEILSCYVYANLGKDFSLKSYYSYEGQLSPDYPKELLSRIYDKLYDNSPAPILMDWMQYITSELQRRGHLSELRMIKQDEEALNAFKLQVPFDILFLIIKNGLSSGRISVNGSNLSSSRINEVTGLDSYLNSFTEILTDKIQASFSPKFRPGIDKYSSKLNTFADYAKYKGIELYDAQKGVIQAASNNLDKNNISLIVSEMGSGKSIMSVATTYVNSKKNGLTNIIICPGHLVYKWKSEIDAYSPMSEAIVVKDFNHFISLESHIKNPKRRRSLFLIMSKETAKFSYEERPSVVWSKKRKCYVCPECGQPLYKVQIEGKDRYRKEIPIFLEEKDFSKKYAYNDICINTVNKWDTKDREYKELKCGTKLWSPLIKEDDSEWIKLPNAQGWMQTSQLQKVYSKLISKINLDKTEAKLLTAVNDTIRMQAQGNSTPVRAPRKYPLAKYIRKYYKKKIDYLIADELHTYKSGDSFQGQAFGDLVMSAKKTICLTGTLLNGYANGLFYILYRTFSRTMKDAGFDYNEEQAFAKQFGVVKRTTKFNNSNAYNGQYTNKLNSKEKILPGVSPLVFTKFLLENSAFMSLTDISDGLPNYTEIPVPIDMDPELSRNYVSLENNLKTCMGRGGGGGIRIMGSMLQLLSVYPDKPYDQEPIVHPDTGDLLLSPPSMEITSTPTSKEQRLIDLVKQKKAAGEKVLIYYHWTNKTDLGVRIPELLAQEGITVALLKSNSSSSKDREEWINKKVEAGIDVLMCNPSLVETGLDLLDFTTIIFYQVGYNLFTLRQASRRSWRLSQTRDIEVYFMYYNGTIQEQALSLMATKLQASQAIEGKFSEEGLHALSNNEDLLTQIANSVVEGIRHTVDINVFNKSSNDNIEEFDFDLDNLSTSNPRESSRIKQNLVAKKSNKEYNYSIVKIVLNHNANKKTPKKIRASINYSNQLLEQKFSLFSY